MRRIKIIAIILASSILSACGGANVENPSPEGDNQTPTISGTPSTNET